MAARLQTLDAKITNARRAQTNLGLQIDGTTHEITLGDGTGDLNVSEGGTIRVTGGDVDVTDGSVNINGGILTVYDSAGNVVATIGTDSHGTGFRSYRADGTPLMASMGAGGFGLNYTSITDRGSRNIIQDDVLHGGIARPYLELGRMVDAAPPGTVGGTTTSSAYVAVQTGFCVRWNPQVRWDAMVSSSTAATTGNVQLVDASGNVIGAPIPVPPGAVSYVTLGPVLWPALSWTPGDAQYLTVQAQRTAGTGTIGVRTTGLWGWAT